MTTNTKTRNYNNGKIYKIECLNGEQDDIYIGSTTKEYLSQRMTTHRKTYKRWLNDKGTFITSYKIFDKYGLDNCVITLIESVNVNTLDELKAREAHYIKTMKCVNKVIPLRTDKEYYEDNIEKIKEKAKDYYEDNKDKISEKYKKYYENNRESILKHKEENKDCRKLYYENNIDKINEIKYLGLFVIGYLREHENVDESVLAC